MLMPTLSVTAIGLIAALVVAMRGRPLGGSLLRGVLGAWLGFVAGALPGIVLDVVMRHGIYVAVLGHALALAGAVIALTLARTRPGTAA